MVYIEHTLQTSIKLKHFINTSLQVWHTSAKASKITGTATVCSIAYPYHHQRKHLHCASQKSCQVNLPYYDQWFTMTKSHWYGNISMSRCHDFMSHGQQHLLRELVAASDLVPSLTSVARASAIIPPISAFKTAQTTWTGPRLMLNTRVWNTGKFMHTHIYKSGNFFVSSMSYLIFHSSLNHLPLVPHMCVSELGQHWFR